MKNALLILCLFIALKSYCQSPQAINLRSHSPEDEEVPLYEGCDESMSNYERRKCLSDKLSAFVIENFDSSILKQLDLPAGSVRIATIFKINTNGFVEDINVNAKYHKLEDEARRVIQMIPQMKPGRISGTAVYVPYTLPIVFQIEGKEEGQANKTFPVARGCNPDLGYELLKKCTTERIMDFVQLNIDLEAVGKLFPLDKTTQFQANFVIDKKGTIKDIKVKAHKREMAELAIKTLKRLPKLKSPKAGTEKLSDTSFGFLMTLYFD